jgi:hypothetical protein
MHDACSMRRPVYRMSMASVRATGCSMRRITASHSANVGTASGASSTGGRGRMRSGLNGGRGSSYCPESAAQLHMSHTARSVC